MADEWTLGELGRSIKRIEDKLDAQMTDHEKRLRALEAWMWRLVGLSAAGIVSGVGAWVQAIVTKGKL